MRMMGRMMWIWIGVMGKWNRDIEVGERARVTAFRTFSRTWHLSLRANSLSDSRIEIFRSAFFVPATCDLRSPHHEPHCHVEFT